MIEIVNGTEIGNLKLGKPHQPGITPNFIFLTTGTEWLSYKSHPLRNN